MEGTIVSFRRGKRTMYGNQMIISVDDKDLKKKIGNIPRKRVEYLQRKSRRLKIGNNQNQKSLVLDLRENMKILALGDFQAEGARALTI